MKKIMTATTFAAFVMMPVGVMAANATLYGNFRYSFANVDQGEGPTATTTLDGVNNASRLGLKGAFEKENLTAFYNYQMGAVNDGGGSGVTSRFYFAGLKGNFGSVKYGRMSTAYKMSAVSEGFDPFYDTSAGNAHSGANYGLSGLTNGFTDNSLEYNSPSFGGVNFNAGFYIDDRDNDIPDHGHGYGAGINYKGYGITTGVQFLGSDGVNVANATDVDTAVRIHARYAAAKFSVGASYELITSIIDADDDADHIYVSATYNFTDDFKLALAYGNEDKSIANGDFDGDGYSGALFYNILPKTQIYALYSTVDADDDTKDRDTIALGFIHSFSIDML